MTTATATAMAGSGLGFGFPSEMETKSKGFDEDYGNRREGLIYKELCCLGWRVGRRLVWCECVSATLETD